jgi:hypothetical protein
MVKELISEYIRSRMEKLNYGTEYYIDFRHLVLQPGQHKDIEAYNDLYVLVEPVQNINIKSDFGMFDLSFDRIDELQYVHQGFISIHNYSKAINHLQFIQVTPILRTKK